MSQPSLITQDLSISFGGHIAVNQVSCEFKPGELTVIVGPNGAGKTTYFNLISGQLLATAGTVLKGATNLTRMSPSSRANHGLGRAFQLTTLFPGLAVKENIRLAVQAKHKLGWQPFKQVSDFVELADKTAHYLQLTKLEEVADLPASALPHGDQRKLEVAMLMAMEPDIYMFDEPTAGMSLDNAPDILNLIAQIKQDKSKIILLVEHKMDVVSSLADRIVVLHNGEKVADGKPEVVMNSEIVRDVYLGKSLEATS